MKVLLMALLILLSAACSTTNKQAAQHDFGLQSASTSSQSAISVSTPQWLWNECIHYRLLYAAPTQLRCYSLDQWIAAPPELFKQLLANKIATKHRLSIELSEFEQQFDSSTQARVVIAIRVNVYTLHTEHLIATQDFRLQQATATPDAAGAVAGFANLTKLATDKIQHWLLSLTKQ